MERHGDGRDDLEWDVVRVDFLVAADVDVSVVLGGRGEGEAADHGEVVTPRGEREQERLEDGEVAPGGRREDGEDPAGVTWREQQKKN